MEVIHINVYACISIQDKKFDALRLLLRPFLNGSRAVVATWLAEYCIHFLAAHVCIC